MIRTVDLVIAGDGSARAAVVDALQRGRSAAASKGVFSMLRLPTAVSFG